MTDTVVITEVSKWFGFKVAVSDVTISFGSGVTGLLGPNGAGKTTLMRLVAGLQKPSQGKITVLGQDPREHVDVYRKMSLVPEDEAMYERESARRFIQTMARLGKIDDPVGKTEDVLRIVGLTDAADRPLGTFSKGMRQRAKVASALVTEPEVLLLDEPLNGADPVQRAELIRLFKELGAAGRTVIVSSHVLAEVERMADRVVAMVDGRLAAVGSVATIRAAMTDRPRQIYVECSDPRRLASALFRTEGVVGVHLEADRLRVEASDARAVADHLPRLAVENGVRVTDLQPADESLESVFRYLVGSR
ncbi:MAG: ABC transporter ATP-binding protein [Acidimicrobiales bacterium]|nr:ABC transporter ATP-binding protein [Acidimicrobiales bacterium]HLV89720.1 ABC transporter ATP-binding protein [Acidimicrobiia bacterium]